MEPGKMFLCYGYGPSFVCHSRTGKYTPKQIIAISKKEMPGSV